MLSRKESLREPCFACKIGVPSGVESLPGTGSTLLTSKWPKTPAPKLHLHVHRRRAGRPCPWFVRSEAVRSQVLVIRFEFELRTWGPRHRKTRARLTYLLPVYETCQVELKAITHIHKSLLRRTAYLTGCPIQTLVEVREGHCGCVQ